MFSEKLSDDLQWGGLISPACHQCVKLLCTSLSSSVVSLARWVSRVSGRREYREAFTSFFPASLYFAYRHHINTTCLVSSKWTLSIPEKPFTKFKIQFNITCNTINLPLHRRTRQSRNAWRKISRTDVEWNHEGWLISSWPDSSPQMHIQFNSFSDSEKSLKLITSVVFRCLL